MNNQKRKTLKSIIAALKEQESKLLELSLDEESALENMPSSLSDTKNAQKMQFASEALSNASAELAVMIESLEEIK